jgi:hypothetical protein
VNDIASTGFSSLLLELQKSNKILVLEDASILCYWHNVTQELGYTDAYKHKQSSSKCILALSKLMVNTEKIKVAPDKGNVIKRFLTQGDSAAIRGNILCLLI